MAVKFDLDNISLSSVKEAKLYLYHYWDHMDFIQSDDNCGNNGFDSVNLMAFEITSDWNTENIDFGDVSNGIYTFQTYSNQSDWPSIADNPIDTYRFDGDSYSKWHSWDVTEAVNNVLAGSSNYGFMIYAADLPQQWYEFNSLVGNWYVSSDNTTKDMSLRPKLVLNTENTSITKIHVDINKYLQIQNNTISLDNTSNKLKSIKLFSLNGQLKYKQEIQNNSKSTFKLSKEFSSGVYIVKIEMINSTLINKQFALF